MKTLSVFIEIDGKDTYVGEISGDHPEDACFCYAESYLGKTGAKPISLCLPLQTEPFSPTTTKNYFEGLLPEGFSRLAVAQWIRTDESDYLTILEQLGQECIGAVRISSEKDAVIDSSYKELNLEQLKELSGRGSVLSSQLLMESRLSLTGASGKVGLYYEKDTGKWYLPCGLAPSSHIVKQSHVRLEKIIVNEQLCLTTARRLGIEVPESFVVRTEENDPENVLFATARFDRREISDRVVDGIPCPLRLHQEDFAQAFGVASTEKYEREQNGEYLSRMFRLLRQYSSDPVEDQLRLWDMIIFQVLIGNTDAHIKNYSLLYDRNLEHIRLAPAYDIISTRMYHLTDQMSFCIGGETHIQNIGKEAFRKAAADAGLGEKAAMNHVDRMYGEFEKALMGAAEELEDMGFQEASEIRDKILHYT